MTISLRNQINKNVTENIDLYLWSCESAKKPSFRNLTCHDIYFRCWAHFSYLDRKSKIARYTSVKYDW